MPAGSCLWLPQLRAKRPSASGAPFIRTGHIGFFARVDSACALNRPSCSDQKSSRRGTFAQLVKIRSRSRLGVYQLQARFPELYAAERRNKRYGHTLGYILKRLDLYPAAIPFIFVTVISRLRAGRQRRLIGEYVWERDNSSRL